MSVEYVTRVRPRMGTLLAVTLRTTTPDIEPHGIAAAFEISRRCEAIMSAHERTSELGRLNRRAGDVRGVRSRELAAILRTARRLAELTEGAFDPTIGALLRLWRLTTRRARLPSARQLVRACTRVGWRAIDVTGPRVALAGSGVSLDLGAFGKGATLDRIARALERRGASGVLNFGESSLRSIGPPPPGGWPIMLRHPVAGFAGHFPLRRRACSTSATFGQHARVGRRIVGHVIDPRVGTPVRANAQVTVLAASAAVAEAASTALLVLGPSAIERLAPRLRVDVCWIDRSGIRTTPGFTLQAPA